MSMRRGRVKVKVKGRGEVWEGKIISVSVSDLITSTSVAVDC